MKTKFIIACLIVVGAIVGIAIALASENALLVHPKGIIAKSILKLIIINIIVMLCIVGPTYIFLYYVVWRWCIKGKGKYDPNFKAGFYGELAMWILPAIFVAILAPITWFKTYELNPYKPLEHKNKPLLMQVVVLNWKWLFIYPEHGIATLNYFHIPEQRPIHLKLTADHTPMNSFWIPQLSGQIYAMTGMQTQLHLMADGQREYTGRAVEINGEGYASMYFSAKSSSAEDFEKWVKEVKKSSSHLTQKVYEQLAFPAINRNIILFSEVEEDLFQKIIDKYKYPAKPVV